MHIFIYEAYYSVLNFCYFLFILSLSFLAQMVFGQPLITLLAFLLSGTLTLPPFTWHRSRLASLNCNHSRSGSEIVA